MIPYTDDHGLREYRHPGVRLRAPWRVGPWIMGLTLVLVGLLWERR